MSLSRVVLHDLHPQVGDFAQVVLAGLAQKPKRLPSMYFYDAEGSRLFDEICRLPEYYPTRTEMTILEQAAPELAREIGPQASIIELGSGSSLKTVTLLQALPALHSYVPVDISKEHLMAAAARIAERFSNLQVVAVCADFMGELRLPPSASRARARYFFFPGSTIGNFSAEQRHALLSRITSLVGARGGGLLVGFDVQKDVRTLERAYNDEQGVTARFNKNLLKRLNRELDANFRLEAFEHLAVYNAQDQRIEMLLVSRCDQTVRICGREFSFASGEAICTEHSYKFTPEGLANEAMGAGLRLVKTWQDPQQLFALQLFQVS